MYLAKPIMYSKFIYLAQLTPWSVISVVCSKTNFVTNLSTVMCSVVCSIVTYMYIVISLIQSEENKIGYQLKVKVIHMRLKHLINLKLSTQKAETHYREVKIEGLKDKYNFTFNELEKCTNKVLQLREKMDKLKQEFQEAIHTKAHQL